MKYLTSIYARTKACFIAIVTTRFSLKSGDKVIVRWNHYRVEATVEGFYCYGIKLKGMRVFPFNTGRFYGCGYNAGGVFFTLRKDWHYYPAKLCEWLRLKLPYKIGKKLFCF
jgi:hypothetical protein